MPWLCLALVFLAACASPPTAEDPTSEQVETATQNEPAPTAVAAQTTAVATATVPDPTQTPAAGDAETERATLFTLSGWSADSPQATLDRLVEAQDTRYIPVLIELIRAAQIGTVERARYVPSIVALEALSGQSFGDDWPAWIEWYGTTDIVPPPGFTTWKGQLLNPIDPRLSDFLKDEFPSRIRTEEIQWGGVRVDGIPSLDNPAMLTVAEADYLEPGDAVFGLTINGESRAYPLRILDWHEMANDVIGGVPVSLAYCTLCGAAVAYDGRASDGQTYTFGSSGFLFRSNKLMFDRQTNTLWNQLTGEPVLGELADEDVTLDLLPVLLTTWQAWSAEHPDTLVVDDNTGFNRDYSTGAAYADYFADTGTMFPVWQRSDLLDTKEQIFALRLDDTPKAYPVAAFSAEPVINDTVGGTPVVLIGSGDLVNVTGASVRTGVERTYSAGSDVRAFARGDRTFAAGPDQDTLVDSEGGVWQITEEALVGPNGAVLERLPGHLAYWFGWFAFFPDTAVYGR